MRLQKVILLTNLKAFYAFCCYIVLLPLRKLLEPNTSFAMKKDSHVRGGFIGPD